jgi:hypothetical protein
VAGGRANSESDSGEVGSGANTAESDGDVLRACRRRAARGADGRVKEHGLRPAICSASLKSCGGRVDTESCTAQAIMSNALQVVRLTSAVQWEGVL